MEEGPKKPFLNKISKKDRREYYSLRFIFNIAFEKKILKLFVTYKVL